MLPLPLWWQYKLVLTRQRKISFRRNEVGWDILPKKRAKPENCCEESSPVRKMGTEGGVSIWFVWQPEEVTAVICFQCCKQRAFLIPEKISYFWSLVPFNLQKLHSRVLLLFCHNLMARGEHDVAVINSCCNFPRMRKSEKQCHIPGGFRWSQTFRPHSVVWCSVRNFKSSESEGCVLKLSDQLYLKLIRSWQPLLMNMSAQKWNHFHKILFC